MRFLFILSLLLSTNNWCQAVKNAVIKKPLVGTSLAVAYFHLRNNLDRPLILTKVTGEDAQTYEIHETTRTPEGVMKMRKQNQLEIPPQTTVKFENGSHHIMLISPNPQLRNKLNSTFKLHFLGLKPVTVKAEVKP